MRKPTLVYTHFPKLGLNRFTAEPTNRALHPHPSRGAQPHHVQPLSGVAKRWAFRSKQATERLISPNPPQKPGVLFAFLPALFLLGDSKRLISPNPPQKPGVLFAFLPALFLLGDSKRLISPNPPQKPGVLFAFLPALLLPGGSDVFSAGSAAPGAGAQPDVTPALPLHLCWQLSKDRSQQRLSALAVLIGGSCSLKRLLNNVKKLCRIFKSLLSEPSYPSSSLVAPEPTCARTQVMWWPRRVPFCHPACSKVALLSGTGQGPRSIPALAPREGGGGSAEVCVVLGQLQAATSPEKSHWQSWFQGKTRSDA